MQRMLWHRAAGAVLTRTTGFDAASLSASPRRAIGSAYQFRIRGFSFSVIIRRTLGDAIVSLVPQSFHYDRGRHIVHDGKY